MSPINYLDYKKYLHDRIRENQNTRGYQGRLASIAGCQRSYLSQVLNGVMELSRDHGAELCQFWNFTDDETEYFLLLIDLARGSSLKLKKHIELRLEKLRKNASRLTEQIESSTLPSLEVQTLYYSSWYWMASHMLLSVPQYKSLGALAARLQLPLEMVSSVLNRLQKYGLVKNTNGEWNIVNTDLHLPEVSPLTEINHFNWRNQAIKNIQQKDPQALHYTSVFSISMEDAEKMRIMMLETILKTRKMIGPSREEDAFCLTCDLFRI